MSEIRTKFYVIMKFTFASIEDRRKAMSGMPAKIIKSECIDEPDNHFPSKRIKMHELNKNETDKCILYRVKTTNY